MTPITPEILKVHIQSMKEMKQAMEKVGWLSRRRHLPSCTSQAKGMRVQRNAASEIPLDPTDHLTPLLPSPYKAMARGNMLCHDTYAPAPPRPPNSSAHPRAEAEVLILNRPPHPVRRPSIWIFQTRRL